VLMRLGNLAGGVRGMSISVEESLSVHARALELRTQRSEILAANLANEETPGFQARDFDFAAEMRRLEHVPAGQVRSALSNGQLQYRVPFQPSQDGNTVEAGVEQAEFARNSMDFHTSLTFLSMKIRGLRQAIEG